MDRLRECRAQGLPGLPRDELLGYMDELARAVDFLNEPRHQAGDGGLVGVQHRDIKPHNIFLVGGSVRLADFGLAKVLEASSASHTGSMSPHYVAPEVLEGRVSRWTDQYSLAVTYAQLRTGRLPFAGDSIDQVIYAHLHEPPDLSGLPEEERPGGRPRPGEAARGPLADVPCVRARPRKRRPWPRTVGSRPERGDPHRGRHLRTPRGAGHRRRHGAPSTQPMVPDTRARARATSRPTRWRRGGAAPGSRRRIRPALAASLVVLLGSWP